LQPGNEIVRLLLEALGVGEVGSRRHWEGGGWERRGEGGLEKYIIRQEDHAVERDRSEGNEKAERGEKKK
jgi:hypothetical protein